MPKKRVAAPPAEVEPIAAAPEAPAEPEPIVELAPLPPWGAHLVAGQESLLTQVLAGKMPDGFAALEPMLAESIVVVAANTTGRRRWLLAYCNLPKVYEAASGDVIEPYLLATVSGHWLKLECLPYRVASRAFLGAHRDAPDAIEHERKAGNVLDLGKVAALVTGTMERSVDLYRKLASRQISPSKRGKYFAEIQSPEGMVLPVISGPAWDIDHFVTRAPDRDALFQAFEAISKDSPKVGETYFAAYVAYCETLAHRPEVDPGLRLASSLGTDGDGDNLDETQFALDLAGILAGFLEPLKLDAPDADAEGPGIVPGAALIASTSAGSPAIAITA